MTMKFKVTGKALWNDVRNYVALGFEIIGLILSIPTVLCQTVTEFVRVKEVEE